MNELSGLSTSQFESLHAKIEQLEHHIIKQANLRLLRVRELEMPAISDELKSKMIKNNALTSDFRETNKAPKISGSKSELKACLQRLCHLAGEKEKTAFSNGAQSIIDDVDKMLEAF